MEIEKVKQTLNSLTDISNQEVESWVNSTSTPSVRQLHRNHPVELKVLLLGLTARFVQKFSSSTTMNEDTISDLVDDMIEDFPHWKVQDFVLFFRQAAKGKFGKTYHGLDYTQIYEWIHKYEEDRNIKLVSQNQFKDISEDFAPLNDQDVQKSKKIAQNLLKSFSGGKDFDEERYKQFRHNYHKSKLKEKYDEQDSGTTQAEVEGDNQENPGQGKKE